MIMPRLLASTVAAMLWWLCASPAHAQAAPSCTFTSQHVGPVDTGITLEQGMVVCRGGPNGSVMHNGAVSILRADLDTRGRMVATTPAPIGVVPPAGSQNCYRPAPGKSEMCKPWQGRVFRIALPTSVFKGRKRKYGPIVYPQFVADAVVDGNLSSNCCRYILREAPTQATWLRGLEIANGVVDNPVRGNWERECEPQSNGQCWSSLFDASLLIDEKGGATIRRIDTVMQLPSGIRTAVTGSDMLVLDGRPVAPVCPSGVCQGEFYGPNSRTAAGLHGRTIMLVAIDSCLYVNVATTCDQTAEPNDTGLQLDEFAALLQQNLGVEAAINLDGGGSTVLGIRPLLPRQLIVNRPSHEYDGCDQPAFKGGCERYVGNALVIGIVKQTPGDPGAFRR